MVLAFELTKCYKDSRNKEFLGGPFLSFELHHLVSLNIDYEKH